MSGSVGTLLSAKADREFNLTSESNFLNRNVEDALLIMRAPELFCRREAIRYELAQLRPSHGANSFSKAPRNAGLSHLQRGLGLMQSKTLRIGNRVGFGSSQPRLPERKSKECDHICDRLVRSLTPVTQNRKWVSLEGLDRHTPISRDSERGREVVKRRESLGISSASSANLLERRREQSSLGPPKLKTPLIPKRQKIPPKEKLLKIVCQEFLENSDRTGNEYGKLERTVESSVADRTAKKVHFQQVSEVAEKLDLPEILQEIGKMCVANKKQEKSRKHINLQAMLLPSLTVAGNPEIVGNSETVRTEVLDLVSLLTQEIPKLRDNGKLLEEIQNDNFDLESFVKIISESLGDELAKALESLKPELIATVEPILRPELIATVEPTGDILTDTAATEEELLEPILLDAAVMTDFESSESPELRDMSSQFVHVNVDDIGTQYSPAEPLWIEAATSYSRRSSEGDGSKTSVLAELTQSYDQVVEEVEEILEPSSPPRDPSLLPPPSIDVTCLLEEKEDVLEKIEEVLSGQTSTEQFSFSQSLRQEAVAARSVEVQTEGFRRLRSTTRKVQTVQVLSSSSLTESSSSTLFTCRETTESEEFTTVSGLSLSEGEVPYSRSPGEVPALPKFGHPAAVSTLFPHEMLLADDLPRLLTLQPSSEIRDDQELVMLRPREREFSFYIARDEFR